jgi:hypothetical protein
MSTKLKIGFPIGEGMRTEHGEPVVRPTPEAYDEHDPEDPADHGPHVDRVGIVAVDSDYEAEDDDDPAPEPRG